MSTLKTNALAHTAPPGAKNLTSQNSANARDADPQYRWDWTGTADGREIFIRGDMTGSGNDLLRIPWWNTDLTDNGSKSLSQETHVEDAPWLVDLNNNTITLASQTTGVLDGVVGSGPYAIASSDLLVFALFDPSDSTNAKFKGFGAFHRPIAAYTTHDDGAKGSSTVLTLAGSGINTGRIFTPNARVIVREGTTQDSGSGAGTGGSPYNQGTITAQTNTSITVTLDNVSTHGTALTAATAGTVIQLDRFEPRLSTSDSLYPGGGTEYNYAYMGSLNVNASQDVETFRKRGDINYNSNASIFSETASATTNYTRSMARILGLHVPSVEIELLGRQTAGGFATSQVRSGSTAFFRLILTNASGINAAATDETLLTGRSAIVPISLFPGAGATIDGSLALRGYTETAW